MGRWKDKLRQRWVKLCLTQLIYLMEEILSTTFQAWIWPQPTGWPRLLINSLTKHFLAEARTNLMARTWRKCKCGSIAWKWKSVKLLYKLFKSTVRNMSIMKTTQFSKLRWSKDPNKLSKLVKGVLATVVQLVIAKIWPSAHFAHSTCALSAALKSEFFLHKSSCLMLLTSQQKA